MTDGPHEDEHRRKEKGKQSKQIYCAFLKIIYLLMSCSHKEATIYDYFMINVVKLSQVAGSLISMIMESRGLAHCGCRGPGGP